jgi:hypothetical protein
MQGIGLLLAIGVAIAVYSDAAQLKKRGLR